MGDGGYCATEEHKTNVIVTNGYMFIECNDV